jgi:hypothetical protein
MENKFDGLLSQMLTSSKGYEGFFDEVFGFLRRKTDFYQNAKEAEKICFLAADKNLKLFAKEKESQQQKQKEEEERKKQRAQTSVKKDPVPEQPQKKEPLEEKPIPVENLENSSKDENKVEEGKTMPNKGNGSSTATYIWTQTLEEIMINIPLPSDTKSKDLVVKINASNILVASKDMKTIYIKGDLFDKIHTDETDWTLTNVNNNRMMEISLTKWKNSMKWWEFLVKGETPIDTQKINPEPSKLSDLDGEMRGTVEKMMFDMRQKEQGLPSSDELEKQEKLKEFMKAHPEFDFSKAKFS